MLLSITGKEGHHSEPIVFYLADLGQEDLILGTDWLQLHNPDINWQTDQITVPLEPFIVMGTIRQVLVTRLSAA